MKTCYHANYMFINNKVVFWSLEKRLEIVKMIASRAYKQIEEENIFQMKVLENKNKSDSVCIKDHLRCKLNNGIIDTIIEEATQL